MNVTELWSLTEWIERELKAARIVGKYEALHKILDANAQGGQAQQPFEKEKNALLAGVRGVRVETLTAEQMGVLDDIGIGPHVGDRGATEIESVLVRNVLDVATAASSMEHAMNVIRDGIQWSDQARGLLGQVVREAPKPEGDQVLLRVKFGGQSSLENVVDLKAASAEWHIIARGLAAAVDEPPETFRLVGASRSSIVFEFATPVMLASVVAGILYSGLKLTQQVLTVMNGVADFKNKGLLSKKLLLEIEKEAKELQATGTQDITNDMVKELGLEGERIGWLKGSIEGIVRFLERDGTIDLVLPEPGEAQEEEEEDAEAKEGPAEGGLPGKALRELRKTASEIRRLEHRVKQLEAGRVEAGSG